MLFGTFAGSRDFNNFLGSMNTMARLSFGLYEYDNMYQMVWVMGTKE